MQPDRSVTSTPISTIPGVNSYWIGGTRFDIPQVYTPIEYINRGAYGVVCSGLHNPSGAKVAIKKIGNIFNNLEETKRLLREIKLLRHFHHENVLSIVDIFAHDEFEDIYLVTELMDTDLQLIVNSDQVLSDQHIQYFLYQLLCGVKYIHSANVLHRDLKPSNILCNEDCTAKLADFGLARFQQSTDDMTEYVATRWYRAPEIILSWKEYSKAIDIWSIGCILAELMLRKPIFQGQDYIHQITRITDILGNPSDEDINTLNSEQARNFLRTMGHKPKIPWAALIPNGNPLAFDLLDKMLAFNPRKRCTAEEALAHPYLEDIREIECERTAEAIFSFDFEKWKLTKEIYKELIKQEISFFHPNPQIPAPLPASSSDDFFSELPEDDTNEMADIDWTSYSPQSSIFETPTSNPFSQSGPSFDQIFGGNTLFD